VRSLMCQLLYSTCYTQPSLDAAQPAHRYSRMLPTNWRVFVHQRDSVAFPTSWPDATISKFRASRTTRSSTQSRESDGFARVAGVRRRTIACMITLAARKSDDTPFGHERPRAGRLPAT
jgi:hypothetical protein